MDLDVGLELGGCLHRTRVPTGPFPIEENHAKNVHSHDTARNVG